MRLLAVKECPRLNSTPLARVEIEGSIVAVEADDIDERRWRFVFKPFQAVRVITADCFDTPGAMVIDPQAVVEVVDSQWIAELRASLGRTDHGATFMNRAHHYLLPMQDEFFEVVAWSVECKPVLGD